jgi:hypothetical protein
VLFLNGLSFLAVIASLLAIKVKPTQLRAGLHYTLTHALILPLLLLTANAGLLGIGVLTLTPAYAAAILHSLTMGVFARRIGLARTVALGRC